MTLRPLLLGALSLGCSQAAVLTSHASPVDFSQGLWTVSPTLTSQYIFRGVKLADSSFQPWVDYTAGPLSIGVWASAALEDRVAGDSDPELDLYGAYTFSSRAGAFSFVPGFYLYTYPDARSEIGLYSTTLEPSLAVVFTAEGIQFTPKLYYDLMLRGATYEITAAIALPLTRLGTELDFTATAGTFKSSDVTHAAAPEVKNWGDYWSFGVAVPVQISVRSKLTLAVLYSEGRNNYYKQGQAPREQNEGAGRHTSVTLGYSITL